jgi:hypothetical protein
MLHYVLYDWQFLQVALSLYPISILPTSLPKTNLLLSTQHLSTFRYAATRYNFFPNKKNAASGFKNRPSSWIFQVATTPAETTEK